MNGMKDIGFFQNILTKVNIRLTLKEWLNLDPNAKARLKEDAVSKFHYSEQN